MKHLLKKALSGFALAVCVTALAACASGTPSKHDHAKYLSQFKQSNQFVEHTVVRSDNHSINAREFGREKKGQQATIVMMHGFPDNQHLYDLLVAELASSRHVITFDFLGWGKSDSPIGMTYPVAVQTQDIEAIMKQFELTKVDIVVHDLSGHAGIDWAVANEAKVDKLVLLNTYYHSMPTLKAPEAIEFYSKAGLLRDIAVWGATKAPTRFAAGVESQISKFFSNQAVSDQFVPIFSHSAAYMRPAFFSSVSLLWNEIETRDRLVDRLRGFKKPVRIIFGADDPYLNPGVALAFSQVFSNHQLVMIPNAGHYVQLDNAKAVARAMQ
jgi:haloalkane dehalogenase